MLSSKTRNMSAGGAEVPRTCRPVFVASHPRSGTHVTIDLIRRQFAECRSWKWPGEYLDHVYLDVDHMRAGHGWLIAPSKANRLLRRAPRPVVKTHCRPGFRELGAAYAGFVASLYASGRTVYVYRDGRDVLCSAHVWLQIADPSARVTLAEFLRQPDAATGLNRVSTWAEHVRAWRARPGVLAVAYEDVLAEPRAAIERIGEHLGLSPRLVEPYLPKRFRGRWHRLWERATRVHPQTTAVLGRFRGREPAKWRQAFGADDRAFFQEHAGDLLRELGYAADDRWVDAPTPSPRGGPSGSRQEPALAVRV